MIEGDKDAEICSQASPTECGPGFLPTTHASVKRGWTNEESRRSQAISYSNEAVETIVIGLIDGHSFTRECIAGFLRELSSTLEIVPFASCEDFLRSARHHDVILYHEIRPVKSSNSDAGTSVEIQELAKIGAVIILSPIDCHDWLRNVLECGVRGFIPIASTTPRQVIEIIRLVNAGGTFAPVSLTLQGIGRTTSISRAIPADQFTARELAVLDRLTHGKANKAIAHELRMSESTVKVHIKSIMSKVNATNRTEVVCRTYDLLDGRAPSSSRD